MLNWNKYYKITELENPSIILKKFFEMKLDNITLKRAIDLGCGSGNDTIYLLKKNYFVTAVDKEKDVIDIIKNRISDTSNLKFIIEKFCSIYKLILRIIFFQISLSRIFKIFIIILIYYCFFK